MKKIIIGIVVVALPLAVITLIAVMHKPSPKSISDVSTTSPAVTAQPQTSSANQPAASQAPAQSQPSSTTSSTATTNPAATTPPKPAAASSPLNLTVNANDDSASPESINATKGQVVNITFAVQDQGTYHNGLEFKSSDPAMDSGPIAIGSSKVVSFTATKSFKFTPFWYASNVQKPYFVTVNVQ